MLSHFVVGDLTLADKGFTIQSLLPPGVTVHLHIPPFLVGKTQLSRQEAEMCRKIVRARIHVARANERIQTFQALNHISRN
jgi:hypothetical protein